MEARLDRLEEALPNLATKDDIQRLHGDNENLHTDIQRLHGDNENLHTDIQRLHGDNENLQTDIKELHTDIQRLFRVTDVLAEKVDALTASVEKLDRKFFQWSIATIASGSVFSAAIISSILVLALQ